jgi:hypothetical protein
MSKPRIILIMEGGVVQNVIADAAVDVIQLDYDGCEDTDAVRVPQDEECEVKSPNDPLATIGRLWVNHLPKAVANLLKLMPE